MAPPIVMGAWSMAFLLGQHVEYYCIYIPSYCLLVETLSTASYHPSISEHVGTEVDRHSVGEGAFDQPGKPRESLVLQLYGINKPCEIIHVHCIPVLMNMYVHVHVHCIYIHVHCMQPGCAEYQIADMAGVSIRPVAYLCFWVAHQAGLHI